MPKILVVDDDLLGQNRLCQVLNCKGYDAMSASDGQTALEKISAVTPDLILLDIKMPEIDGFEVAGRIKGNPETCNIPIILITGHDTVDHHVRALEMGADDYISKTAAHAAIVARVRAHLRTKQLNDQMKTYQQNLEKEALRRTNQLNHTLKQLRFDPNVVDAFFSAQDAMLRIKETFQDDMDSLMLKMNLLSEAILMKSQKVMRPIFHRHRPSRCWPNKSKRSINPIFTS